MKQNKTTEIFFWHYCHRLPMKQIALKLKIELKEVEETLNGPTAYYQNKISKFKRWASKKTTEEIPIEIYANPQKLSFSELLQHAVKTKYRKWNS